MFKRRPRGVVSNHVIAGIGIFDLTEVRNCVRLLPAVAVYIRPSEVMTLPNLPVVVRPSPVPPPPTTAATVVRDFVTTTTTTKCAHNSRAEVPRELWPVSTSHLQGLKMVGKGAADKLVLRLPTSCLWQSNRFRVRAAIDSTGE